MKYLDQQSSVLNQLDKAGLLKSKTVASIYTKFNSYSFKANVYVLNKNMDLKKILTILEGDKDYISAAKNYDIRWIPYT
mgnify:CR=1 FL=1